MQVLAIFAGLLAASTATPVETRQEAAPAAKCADWGPGFGGSVLFGPTDAQASRCCIYGESIINCCRNDPALAQDPYWSHALECTSPFWANTTTFGDLYACNVSPESSCAADCADVPYLFTGARPCDK